MDSQPTNGKDSHIKRGELTAILREYAVVILNELLRDCIDIGHYDEQSQLLDLVF